MIRVGLVVLVAAVVLWFLLGRLEQAAVFQPTRPWDIDPAVAPPAQPLEFSSADGVLLSGLWMPAPESRGVLVYAHGNAGNLSHRIFTADAWRHRLGLSILLFDYRGYGRSEGRPSEEGIFEDTLAAFREGQRLGGEAPLLLGRSLGSVPAIRVAAQESPRALILDSPLASAAAMAHRVLPLPGIGYLPSMRLDNLSEIPKVQCPLLVLHSPQDQVVPVEQGRQVFDAATARTKSFILLAGEGHNGERTSEEVLNRIEKFLFGAES